jgi:hypothetical protein
MSYCIAAIVVGTITWGLWKLKGRWNHQYLDGFINRLVEKISEINYK